MNIELGIFKLKKEIDFIKLPSYDKLVKLKLKINKFYLENNFEIDKLEYRKKMLSNDLKNNFINLSNSFIIGISSGAYLNIINYIYRDSNFIIIVNLLVAIITIIMAIYFIKNNINQYIDELNNFEIDLINKLLKENLKEKFLNDIKTKKDFLNKYKWYLEKAEEYKNDFDSIEDLKNEWRNKIIKLELEIKILEKELL